MNNLEELELSDPGVGNAIHALNPDKNKSTQGSDSESDLERAKVISPVLLPKLKTLRIRDTSFSASHQCILASCLESRKRANHELCLLVLESCRNARSGEVERYKKHAKKVYWNCSDNLDGEDDQRSHGDY